jgi:Mg-chelatase subunit ChlD
MHAHANAGRAEEARQIMDLAARFSFKLEGDYLIKAVEVVPKSLMFAIDVSGSMAGMKLRAAVENVNTMITDYVFETDLVGVTTFNHTVSTIFGLHSKVEYGAYNSNSLSKLQASGGSFLYDAIYNSCRALMNQHIDGRDDWLVVLTDGADGESTISLQSLCTLLQEVSVKLIIIGVGDDVETEVLTSIVASTNPPGMYFAASSDKSNMAKTFTRVSAVIQGQLILEEI